MAWILCGKDNLVCVSDSSFIVYCHSKTTNPVYQERRTNPRKDDKTSGPKIEMELTRSVQCKEEDPAKRSNQGTSDLSHLPSGRILTCCFSPSGRYFALCDDFKSFSLYTTEQWHQLSTRTTSKRCMALAFSQSDDTVIVADKFGDAYKFSVTDPNEDGSLILGHLSMLLDVVLTGDGSYIVTADRDEKIRVSNLPNAYNIHTYCLGHTEFVSRLALVQGFDKLLVSGGGDSTLRFWDYSQGRQLHYERFEPLHESRDGENRHQIVTGITCSQTRGLVAVTLLGSECIAVYHVTHSAAATTAKTASIAAGTAATPAVPAVPAATTAVATAETAAAATTATTAAAPTVATAATTAATTAVTIKKISSVDCGAVCWSACFDHLDRLWVLRQLAARPIAVFSVTETTADSFSLQPLISSEETANITDIVNHINEDWAYFENAMSTASPFEQLYKRSFDNITTYFEKKEQRIKQQEQKKRSPRGKGLTFEKKPKLVVEAT